MVKRGLLLGKPQYTTQTLTPETKLTFEYYLCTMKIVEEYARKHI